MQNSSLQTPVYPVSQNLVVATRVNPSAKTDRKRTLRVRVWNSRQNGSELPPGSIEGILRAHYFGTTAALSLWSDARKLAEVASWRSILSGRYPAFFEGLSHLQSTDRVSWAVARPLSDAEPLVSAPEELSTYICGNTRLRIGLVGSAWRLIQLLQEERFRRVADFCSEGGVEGGTRF